VQEHGDQAITRSIKN